MNAHTTMIDSDAVPFTERKTSRFAEVWEKCQKLKADIEAMRGDVRRRRVEIDQLRPMHPGNAAVDDYDEIWLGSERPRERATNDNEFPKQADFESWMKLEQEAQARGDFLYAQRCLAGAFDALDCERQRRSVDVAVGYSAKCEELEMLVRCQVVLEDSIINAECHSKEDLQIKIAALSSSGDFEHNPEQWRLLLEDVERIVLSAGQ